MHGPKFNRICENFLSLFVKCNNSWLGLYQRTKYENHIRIPLYVHLAVIVLLWLLHQKGLFDPIYDWWDDRFGSGDHYRHSKKKKATKPAQKHHNKPHNHHHHHPHHHHHHHQHHKTRIPHSPHAHKRKRADHSGHHLLHKNVEYGIGADDRHSRQEDSLRVHKEGPKHKHRHSSVSPLMHQRLYGEIKHEPLSRDEQDIGVVHSHDRLRRDHAH
jgi:hypothetical protein